jgi:hypothetical protein
MEALIGAAVTVLAGILVVGIFWGGAGLTRRRQVKVGRKTLVVAWATLIAAMVFSELKFGLAFLHEDWSWKWVERASWAVAIIGLPLLVYQVAVLRREQAREPRIAFGVAAKGAEIHQLSSSADVVAAAGRAQIETLAKNVGNLTARGLLFNCRFAVDSPVASIEPAAGSGDFIAANRLWQAPIERIQPGNTVHLTATLVFRPGFTSGSVPLEAAVAMDDFEQSSGTVTVRVTATGAVVAKA